jgi:CubicO group peptidase (beta-lactamase class C family)
LLDVYRLARNGSEPLPSNETLPYQLSPHGVQKLHDVLASHVATGEVPGLVSLVARGDEVDIATVGTPSFTDDRPLARQALFRIASLTKPITAVAALALVEEGLLRLDQPVDELLPELSARRVLRSIDADLDDTVPARRPILVEDLLSSRLGFGSLVVPPDSYPIQRAEADAGLQSIGGPPWPPIRHNPDGWIRALGSLPLMYQPGERWLYNTSYQVLGVLLARACGKPLESVLRTRVFDPLEMVDTGFAVPPEDIDRLTTLYGADPDTGVPSVLDEGRQSWWGAPPSFPCASGWLVSTIDDYWSFVTMLLAGGAGKDGTVLSPGSVARLTTDQQTPAQREGSEIFLGPHGSWGLGLTVPARDAGPAPFPSGIGWDGGTGTTWRSNPGNGITGILFTQRQATSPSPPPLMDHFWACLNALAAA